MTCMVTEAPAIWAGVETTLTHVPPSAVSAPVTATSDFTSKEVSERVNATGSVPVQLPPPGDWISTVRLTSLTVDFVPDMSSSWRRTHLTRVEPAARGAEKGTQEIGEVVEAVWVMLALTPAAPSAP